MTKGKDKSMPLDTVRLREEIRKVYSEVVRDPKKGYHFHTGPEYAVERLGYSPEALAELPDSVTAPFAGVGNPLSMGLPTPGGRLQIADIVVHKDIPPAGREDIAIWTA